MNSLVKLCEYSSSEDEETQDKKPKLPPPKLPKTEVNNRWLRPDVSNPENHDGRQRSFAHEAGNWATYVYIPNNNSLKFQNYAQQLQRSLCSIDLNIVDNIHISLTRTVVLRHHWINDFISMIQNKLKYFPNFNICTKNVNVWTNEEKTRTFVGLDVSTGAFNLTNIVKVLDKVLTEYKLPQFYDNPEFHCSIAWCLGDQKTKLLTLIENLPQSLTETNFIIFVEYLLCSCGNKTFTIPLCDK